MGTWILLLRQNSVQVRETQVSGYMAPVDTSGYQWVPADTSAVDTSGYQWIPVGSSWYQWVPVGASGYPVQEYH